MKTGIGIPNSSIGLLVCIKTNLVPIIAFGRIFTITYRVRVIDSHMAVKL